MISFEMNRVWDEVRQARAQIRENTKQQQRDQASDSVENKAVEQLKKEVEGLRGGIERVKAELTTVKQASKKVDKNEAIGVLRDEMQRTLSEMQDALEEVRIEAKHPQEKELSRPNHAGEEMERALLARLNEFGETQKREVESVRGRMSALERKLECLQTSELKRENEAMRMQTKAPEAMRVQQIEADLAKLQSEVSRLLRSSVERPNTISKSDASFRENEQRVKELERSVQSIQNQVEQESSRDVDGFIGRLEMLRRDLEQGLAKSEIAMVLRIERLEKEACASSQKLKLLQGRDLLLDLAGSLPSPAAKEAEAVACASRRTEDQLAKVEERIGLMLGLVSKGEAKGTCRRTCRVVSQKNGRKFEGAALLLKNLSGRSSKALIFQIPQNKMKRDLLLRGTTYSCIKHCLQD